MIKWDLFWVCRLGQHLKINYGIHYNWPKNKNSYAHLKKSIWKYPTPTQKLEIGGKFLDLNTYEIPTVNIILNSKKLGISLLWTGTRQVVHSTSPIQYHNESPY